jgi:peptidoglycan/LPS O-acetylase OafA/YrhL
MFNYRREIDGLRALAVVPVILFHAGFETFSGGFVGVDVFFVISGYLITSIILTQKSSGTFSLSSFYERRARRILPPLFLVMIFCILFSWLWLMPNYMKDFSKSLVASSVFVSNILFWQQSSYFDLAEELKPLLHTWSLSVEVQYYLFFPLFILIMWRFTKLSTVVSIVFITVLSFGLAQWGVYNKPEAAFFLLLTRAWEFTIGVLVAFYFVCYPKMQLNRQVQEIGSLIGVIFILYAVFDYSKKTPFPSVYTLAPVLGTAFIIIYATPSTLVGRVLSTKFFVGAGLISYSAYLWHHSLFVFARIIFGQIQIIGFVLLFTLTFIIAYFTYKYVELPFRKNKLNFFNNFSFIFLLFLLIFFILFGLYGYFTNGIERRLSPNEFNFSQTLKRSTEINCSLSIRDCVTKASNAPSVLLLGDSNAYHFSTSLKEASETSGFNYYQLTKGGCLPLGSYFRLDQNYKYNRDCINFNLKIREAFSENGIKIDIIVVSAGWLMYLEGEDL